MSLEEARRVIDSELAALGALRERLDASFTAAVDILHTCRGRVVVTGVGKSGLVGRMLAATLSSCGTPALFLHAGEGAHGDVGVILPGDVVLALSQSGETEEVLAILPAVKKIGARLVVLTGRADSTLARRADAVLLVEVEREACPLGLAPTSSSTAQKVLGDALAMALLSRKGFTEEKFALFHPGGSLGKKLLMRVSDLMHSGDENPVLSADAPLEAALDVLLDKRLGAVSLVDGEGKLAGIIVDGDLKRGLKEYREKFLARSARDIMIKTPVTIRPDQLAVEAFALMENRPSQISVLPVVDAEHRPVGMLRMHDLVRAGIY
ncbi:KpsF/GutQ family sugar-phosphate isomerase [bacterium]|nr:KpsF/GutQ family sugar-phosphate isomerase [bacterium]